MQEVTVQTSYPTVDPTDSALEGALLKCNPGIKCVNVKLHATSGSGTYTLLGYDSADWVPIGDVNIDSTVYGGYGFGRFTPGIYFSHFTIFEKISGATLDKSSLGPDLR